MVPPSAGSSWKGHQGQSSVLTLPYTCIWPYDNRAVPASKVAKVRRWPVFPGLLQPGLCCEVEWSRAFSLSWKSRHSRRGCTVEPQSDRFREVEASQVQWAGRSGRGGPSVGSAGKSLAQHCLPCTWPPQTGRVQGTGQVHLFRCGLGANPGALKGLGVAVF